MVLGFSDGDSLLLSLNSATEGNPEEVDSKKNLFFGSGFWDMTEDDGQDDEEVEGC